ncbi:hypothetical protein PG994_003349 [Apiospora phragmitis]|uniref:Ankyrin n=1 Tax=Apiospora phragmitis TaxID=2905665 RepID=A0ABR1VY22_9PEZI
MSVWSDFEEDSDTYDDPEDPEDEVSLTKLKDDNNRLFHLPEPKWRPLTILQWAAVAGNEAAAEKAIIVAEREWPSYVFLKHLDSLNSALHFAAWYGNTGILRLLSQVRKDGVLPDMNILSGMTWEPRQGCVFHQMNPSIGYFPDREFIMSHNDNDAFGLSAAGIAITRNHANTAEYLVDNFYDNDMIYDILYDGDRIAPGDNYGYARVRRAMHPLHLACWMGMEKVVTAILEKGAHVDTISKQMAGSTPLMWAVASPNNGPETSDALVWAVLFQSHENALHLVQAGARADLPFDRIFLGYYLYLYKECSLVLCMEDDAFLRCTKLILQRHPDFPEGLLRSCTNNALRDVEKNQATIKWLIGQGIGLGPLQEGESREVGMSALHLIAGSNALPLDLLSLVLDKRPQDINVASKINRHTPLSMALKLGYDSEKVAWLLAHGADPQACSVRSGRDVLMAVKKGRRTSEIEKIQADLNVQKKDEGKEE